MRSKPAIWTLFLAIGVGVASLDLWTKSAVFDVLGVEVVEGPGRPVIRNREGLVDPATGRPKQEHVVIIPGCFDLEATINYGAFSGWFSRHTGYLALLSLAALFIIAGFVFFSSRAPRSVSPFFIIALGLLWGGTLGNFYDRWFIGGVRDFIRWFVVVGGKEHVWPNFNIADSAICAGVGLIVLLEILRGRSRRTVPADNPAEPAGRTVADGS